MKDNEINLKNYLVTYGKGNKTYDKLSLEFGVPSRRVRTIWNKITLSEEIINDLERVDDFDSDLVPPTVPKGFEVTRGGITATGAYTYSFIKKEPKIDYEDIFRQLSSFRLVKQIEPYTKEEKIYHLVISDVHIGMSTKNSLYDKHWNINQLTQRLQTVASSIPPGSKVIIHQLGDYADGERGKTASNTHNLEQNMSDAEIFENGVTGFMYFVDLINTVSEVTNIYWLSNSNHPTVVDKNIGTALKIIFSQKYPGLEFNILDDSFNIVEINNTKFIITHGKDRQYMKYGLPKMLGNSELYKLKTFSDYYNLNKVVLLRGDLHQYLDVNHGFLRDIMCPSLAPPSGWVATNFLNPFNGGFLILEQTQSNIDVKFRPF